MTTLRHAVTVKTTRSQAFRALTSLDQLAQWHVGAVDGAVAQGAIFRLTSDDGLQFDWRTDALNEDAMLTQTCVSGPGSAVGKTLTISLVDQAQGRTRVELQHDGWSDSDAHLAPCNTYWGAALMKLRNHLEQQGARA